MKSKWYDKKSMAVATRKKGISIITIEKEFGIPRSTLSGWFKNIELSSAAQHRLEVSRTRSLKNTQKKGAQWHHDEREKRVKALQREAAEVVSRLNSQRSDTLELALAMLYFGEGTKREKGLVLGNSNPDILIFFLSSLRRLYTIDGGKIRCQLNLRADQIPLNEITYWSKTLKLNRKCFSRVYIDKRTLGRKTYSKYHGVCVIQYGDVALQRKLMYLYQLYCQKVIQSQKGG
jgi:hypothetical protein